MKLFHGFNPFFTIISNLKNFTVVIFLCIGYNRSNLRCTITLVNFEPTFSLNGIPILLIGCQALTRKRIGREGKRLVAVTHLALLGVKKQDAAFWVITKEKEQSFWTALLRYYEWKEAERVAVWKEKNGN